MNARIINCDELVDLKNHVIVRNVFRCIHFVIIKCVSNPLSFSHLGSQSRVCLKTHASVKKIGCLKCKTHSKIILTQQKDSGSYLVQNNLNRFSFKIARRKRLFYDANLKDHFPKWSLWNDAYDISLKWWENFKKVMLFCKKQLLPLHCPTSRLWVSPFPSIQQDHFVQTFVGSFFL